MNLLELFNSKNWRTELHENGVKVQERDGYVLVKYVLGETDFSKEWTLECRGHILKQKEDGEWVFVCRPFDKFFNYGEVYASEIDWRNASVLEKIDGSLMKLWWDGEWHYSTNGMIDAFEGDGAVYGKLFKQLLIEKVDWALNQEATHMFELVSPQTQVIVHYDKPELFYLGSRYNKSGEEFLDEDLASTFSTPKQFNLFNIEEVLKVAKHLGENEEGFVIVDKNFSRIKVKGEWYLNAARLSNNRVLTLKRMVEIWKEDKVDDLVAYCPWHKEYVDNFYEAIVKHRVQAEMAFNMYYNLYGYSIKAFANIAKNDPYSSFLFRKFRNKDIEFIDWLKGQTVPAIERIFGTLEI